MGIAPLSILLVLLVSVPTGVGPLAWSKTIAAPYHGFDWTGTNQSGAGHALTNYSAPGFNFTSGTGSLNGSMASNSTILPTCPSPGHTGDCTNIEVLTSTFYVAVDVQFKNHSGMRQLTSVNLTLNYSVSINVTLNSGTCPWVSSTKKVNDCFAESTASAGAFPVSLSYADGRNNTPGYCSMSCIKGHAGGGGVGLGVFEKNSSRGLSLSNGSTQGSASFKISGTASLQYIPTMPLRHSGKILVKFSGIGLLDISFGAKYGAGGLRGAYATASVVFSMTVVSIVLG